MSIEQLVDLRISHFCCLHLIENIAQCGYLGDFFNTNICRCVIQADDSIGRPFSSASKLKASTKGMCNASVDTGISFWLDANKKRQLSI
jgi:hypothetical protein